VGSLGEGAFGKVKKVIKKINDTQEKEFAIKILKKSVLKRKKEFYKDEEGSIINIFYYYEKIFSHY
jgi:hypothetical protein